MSEQKGLKKSPEYMRQAYIYTGILFLIALIGSSILATRIIGAEARDQAAQEAQEEQEGASTEQERRR